MGGLGMAAAPTNLLAGSEATTAEKPENPGAQPHRPYNTPYTGDYLNRLAFPIGGIGAGMFCLEGAGAISHLSIRHHPDLFNEIGRAHV